MSGKWLFVLVLICVENVFANNSCDIDFLRNCDECIRCGANWCEKLSNNHDNNCAMELPDSYCNSEKEPIYDGKSDVYLEKRLHIGHLLKVPFAYYNAEPRDVHITLKNSTQSNQVWYEQDDSTHICEGAKCSLTIEVKALPGFCTNVSTYDEHFFLSVKVDNMTEEAIFKFNVHCACACSKYVEKKSLLCYNHGDFSCGACDCYTGWSGAKCEIKEPVTTSPRAPEIDSPKCNKNGLYSLGQCICNNGWSGTFCEIDISINVNFEPQSPDCNYHGDLSHGNCICYDGWGGKTCDKRPKKCVKSDRGDSPCSSPRMSNVDCLGNGKCLGPCESCVCHHDRQGSQYFDPKNYCSDVCTDSMGCETCLTNDKVGPCNQQGSDQCAFPITVLKYNETVAAQRDRHHRIIWARCNETFKLANKESCHVRYVAMRTEDKTIRVMIVESCHTTAAEKNIVAAAGGTSVPLILGIIFGGAAVAAITGFVLRKYMNTGPRMPFVDSQYQNIETEGSVGVNPLYIQPTSEYKNPTYGKGQ